MRSHGFDVSQYQPTISFERAAENHFDFCFARASIGVEYDTAYSRHADNAQGSILLGPYHALLPGETKKQATVFYSAVFGSAPATLFPVVDVEKNGLDEAQLLDFLIGLMELWETPVIIYTSYSKWNNLIGNRKWAANFPLWVAHKNVQEPLIPKPWTEWKFWQFTVSEVSFWKKKIDRNVFYGTRDDLRVFKEEMSQLWDYRFSQDVYTLLVDRRGALS